MIDFAFYTATAFYFVAVVLLFAYLKTVNLRWLHVAAACMLGGIMALGVCFLLRWHTWGRVPLTSSTDVLNLLVLLSTSIMLIVAYRDQLPTLLCFYLPPVAVTMFATALTAGNNLRLEPRPLPGMLLAIHVGLAFCAYSLFFVAAMTSLAYLSQAHRLKDRKTAGGLHRLPPLERLDQSLFRLIRCGYPLFVTTLILGGIWAALQPSILGEHWWMAPKVMLSFVSAVFFAGLFHLRHRSQLPEPRLAQVVFWGASTLLLLYLVLELVHLRTYNFWGAGA